MSDDLRAEAEKKFSALERWMAPFFDKAPHLPDSARHSIVSIAPWLALIFGVLGIIGLLSASMFWSMFSFAFYTYGFMQVTMIISLIAGLVASVLQLLAYQPLTAHKKKGWNFLFYGTVLTTLAALLDMVFGYGSGAIGHILGALVGFWLLFEVRSLYHK